MDTCARPGKSIKYKQKRCINFAKRGILALNLEWLALGNWPTRKTNIGSGLIWTWWAQTNWGCSCWPCVKDSITSTIIPSVNRSRLGVTGLSGGGWQTIVLSALDERVTVAIPVAGFSSLVPRIEARWLGDLGDLEQSATDFLDGQDFTHLAAMLAPTTHFTDL